MGLVLLMLMSVPLSGCAQTGTQSGSDARDAVAIDAPDFSGPWADELTSAYRSATSDFERTALEDGAVSDGEHAEMEQAFRSCLGDKRVDFSGFDPDGSYEFTGGKGLTNDEANKIANDCSVTTGVNTVGMLYSLMRSNPDNLDTATITAACLVRKGVVPEGYTASDYNRDAPDMAFPFRNKEDGETALKTCNVDPLGLLGLDQ